MKRLYILLIIILVISVQFSIYAQIDKSSSGVNNTILQDYQAKKKVFNSDFYFKTIDSEKNDDLRNALKFLYAYMPLNDITDYDSGFYRENVCSSLQTREVMPWGKDIPDQLFRHFVLPVRVNNEHLDRSRMVFYEELKDRVKHLSLKQAILEVNHWCHEKVIYAPSDARTSSPLATMKSAYGRCGEESTFLVAALRAVGIPARQVYTPRWAHTDDNHAWVEAWADGKWHFMGACEPEPVLNLGWFNIPASRGMLMHTKVFGRYDGPEEVMNQTANFTEINIIHQYAPSSPLKVKILDAEGKIIENALVEFKVYNYAEFFTVASKFSDKNGETQLSAGLGDMLVWASKDNRFGFQKVSFGKEKNIEITLDKKTGDTFTLKTDIFPPVGSQQIPLVSPEERKKTELLLQYEDSIRNAYTNTFISKEDAISFCRSNGYPEETSALLLASRGNHQTISLFLAACPTDKKEKAVKLLHLLSAKDLRDVSPDVLNDNLLYTKLANNDNDVYLLSPRVENEMLVPYKSFFQQALGADKTAYFFKHPEKLVDWCIKNIRKDETNNAQNLIMSPVSVWNARVTNRRSEDVFFVALARSCGIPAWKDPVNGKIFFIDLYSKKNIASEAIFDITKESTMKDGILKLNYKPLSWLPNPKYSSHFTISKIENGKMRLLTYDEEKVNWENTFKDGTKLEAGAYLLTTGTRLASGAVLSEMTFFNVVAGKTITQNLNVRESNQSVQVIGNFNSENNFTTLENLNNQSILKTTGRGYFIVGIIHPGQEPSKHALKDISMLKNDFEKWGRKMILLFQDKQSADQLNLNEFSNLPNNIVFGLDNNQLILNEIVKNLNLKSNTSLPVFIIADTFNRVVFVSQGYTIGIGEQLMKVIHGL